MNREHEMLRQALREAIAQHVHSDSELDQLCQSFDRILQKVAVQGEAVQDMAWRASMAAEIHSIVQAAVTGQNSKR